MSSEITYPAVHALLEGHGIRKITPGAEKALDDILRKIVHHALRNVMCIVNVCKCKVIRAKHFDALKTILHNQERAAMQSGGRYLLPSQYFSGGPSDNYVTHPSATVMDAIDVSAMSRPALPYQAYVAQGGMHQLMTNHLQPYIASYRTTCKLSADAKQVLLEIVKSTMDKLMGSLGKKEPVQESTISRGLLKSKLTHLM